MRVHVYGGCWVQQQYDAQQWFIDCVNSKLMGIKQESTVYEILNIEMLVLH